eukprot:TRINITY_DN673_c0_g1_i5.p3 TRINITY_DN673_c0_g1~~TRINITY_DN673_c0_g1_i5.p3  ORF type:complete len:107 (-),score=20.57 TRINITY_DN673_c0_g1_i5:446-766(-)
MQRGLVGSEMCIRDRVSTQSTWEYKKIMNSINAITIARRKASHSKQSRPHHRREHHYNKASNEERRLLVHMVTENGLSVKEVRSLKQYCVGRSSIRLQVLNSQNYP